MKTILTVIYFALYISSWGQTPQKENCKVEIYLLNKVLPGIDTIKKSCNEFFTKKQDLQDTPFIRDEEILSFSIRVDTTNAKLKLSKSYVFQVLNTAPKKINSLEIPLFGGRQFAVIANKKIIYSGYFWNSKSTLKWNWIMAYADENWIIVEHTWPAEENVIEQDDKRSNPFLLECLKKTGRLIE